MAVINRMMSQLTYSYICLFESDFKPDLNNTSRFSKSSPLTIMHTPFHDGTNVRDAATHQWEART